MVQFTVFGNAKGKGRPKFRRTGNFVQTYTDKETLNYEQLVRLSFLQENEEKYMDKQPLEMEVVVYQQIPSSFSKKKTQLALNKELRPVVKPDIDNILKSILDGLNKVAYADDTQIVSIKCDKYYDTTPRVEIKLWEI